MNFIEYAGRCRDVVSQRLSGIFSDSSSLYSSIEKESLWLFSKMREYACSGKMLRGTLAILGFDLGTGHLSGLRDDGVLSAATALELFQAGLLVHDDIMDRDASRRGMPTLHKAFEAKELSRSATAGAAPWADVAHTGEALGICAGDIYFFLAWKQLERLPPFLCRYFSDELVKVCLAQMKDVRTGGRSEFPSMEEIISIYTYKTARYTVTLPLSAGIAISGHGESLPAIEKLGANLGILFQIQDDSLGLFGDEKHLGKPVGSDIREGKKTPFMILLSGRLSGKEKIIFEKAFGNPLADEDAVNSIRALVRHHGIDREVFSMASGYASRAREAISSIRNDFPSLNTESLDLLEGFVSYSLSRIS